MKKFIQLETVTLLDGSKIDVIRDIEGIENCFHALNYYRSVFEDKRPDFVPSKIMLPITVTSDLPFTFYDRIALSGEHECQSNQWGAVSVKATDGKILGIKPGEFEPIEWCENKL